MVTLNEFVDMEKNQETLSYFKVDFEKVCDSVSLRFLDYTLIRFGVCEKWKF